MISKANDSQVGGTHYAQDDKPQHWDLVQLYGWDYFQGQITKYLMRWKTKHNTPEKRLEDLLKARHFLDKYIEIQQGNVVKSQEGQGPLLGELKSEHYALDSNEKFQCEGWFGDRTQLYKCVTCKLSIRSSSLAGAAQAHDCGAEATKSYVDQG